MFFVIPPSVSLFFYLISNIKNNISLHDEKNLGMRYDVGRAKALPFLILPFFFPYWLRSTSCLSRTRSREANFIAPYGIGGLYMPL